MGTSKIRFDATMQLFSTRLETKEDFFFFFVEEKATLRC